MNTQQMYAGKPIIDISLTDPTQGNSVTKKVNGKSVLRPSSLDIHCPYSYAQSAILGKKSKPSGASSGGTAYHYALELAYDYKIQTQTNPNPNDIIEIGVENWKKAQTVEELHYSEKDSPDKMTDDIAKGLATYVPTISKITPVATEIRWSVALPKPSSVYSQISGSMDLLTMIQTTQPSLGGSPITTQGIEIVDHKFTSKKATSPKYKLQAGLYEIMGNANLPLMKGFEGMKVEGTVLHNMVRSQVLKTKTNPTNLELVRPTRGEAVTNTIASRVNELIDRAEMHHFMTTELSIDPEESVKVLYPTTTPEQSFLCNQLWCGWWSQCFVGDIEVLTDRGFVRFDSLNKTELIAQVHTDKGNAIEFVKPIRYVHDQNRGDLVRIKHDTSHTMIDVICTAEHEFIYEYQKSRHDPVKVKRGYAKDIPTKADRYKIMHAGSAMGSDDELTTREKLAIAFQADGHLDHTSKSGVDTLQFRFTKPRKIKQFMEDFDSIFDLRVGMYDGVTGIRFNTTQEEQPYSKRLRNVFNTENLSTKKARAMLDYIVLWDGSIMSEHPNLYRYGSIVKDNTDFIQELCILSGYRSKISVRAGTEVHSTYYHISINKDTYATLTRRAEVTKLDVSDDVYCVTVPTGAIVVRGYNGVPFITGNCPINNPSQISKLNMVDIFAQYISKRG